MSDLHKFLAFSIIGTVAIMRLLVLPAMIGVLVDEGGLSEVTAGWLASMGAMGSAGISLLMAFQMHHINPHKVAVVALIIATAAECLSAFSVGPTIWFFGLRMVAGIASGAAYVIAIAAFARLEHFDRGYGLFVTLQFIVSGLGLYVLPVYSEGLGVEGMYFTFAGLNVIALMLTPFLSQTASADIEGVSIKSEWRVLLSFATLAAVLAFACFEMANNAQFTFIERFGVSLNLSDDEIGGTLLIASLIGIPGAFTIVILGERFGVIAPLTFGIGVAVLGLGILILAKSSLGYLIGGCFMGFSWAFCLPYIQAFLAKLDREGSALAAGSTASSIGGAAGPAIAANVLGQGNYVTVFGLTIALFCLALLLFNIASIKAA